MGVKSSLKGSWCDGLYCDPNKIKIDGRSFFGKLRKKIRGHLLEVFKSDPSPIVQTLAHGTAANVIMAKAFQASFLRGREAPPYHHARQRDPLERYQPGFVHLTPDG